MSEAQDGISKAYADGYADGFRAAKQAMETETKKDITRYREIPAARRSFHEPGTCAEPSICGCTRGTTQ